MKRLIAILFLIPIFTPIFAQQQTPLPSDFDYSGCAPHQLIFKLKSQEDTSPDKKFAEAKASVPLSVLQKIASEQPKALFPKDSPLFQKRESYQMSIYEKQLPLIYRLKLNPEVDLVQAINLLRQDPAILYAEPIYTNHAPLIVPNDPFVAPGQQYHLTKIRAFQAWDIETGDPSVFIGITDNGFDIADADLTDNVRAPILIDSPSDLNNDLSGDEANVFDDADNDVSGGGHGHVVALCSSAVPDNSVGTAGTGYHCKFLAVKVAADDNLGSYTEGYQGILYAAKQGSAIINMSWGRKGLPSAFEEDVINTAYQYTPEGIVLVAAAGNDNTTEFFYPASYENVLAVAASNSNDFKADFSTFNEKVDITAPGQGIRVLSNPAGASGTSFASPLVAGAAALLRSRYPTWHASQVLARLKTTTDDIYQLAENQAYIDQLGTGRLNMERMLSDPLKAITLEDYIFSAGQRGFLFRDTVSDFVCDFKNQLNTLDNLSITLTSSSPFIQILNGTVALGNISEYTDFQATFSVELLANAPANTVVQLEFTYQDGTYTYTEKKKILMNPGHLDINQSLFSVADNGRLGIDNQNYPELSGFAYDYPSQLSEAGLIIATSAERVSDATRNAFNGINQDFTTQKHFRPIAYQANTYLETEAVFEDFSNNNNRIGVEVTQKTYSWNEANLQKGHVIEYQLRNLNNTRIDSLYAAIFADWSVYQEINNRAGWVASQNLGYVRNSFSGSAFMGIQVITPSQGVNFYAFDDVSSIKVTDGFTDAEKFQAISGGIQNTSAGNLGQGADVAHTIGVTVKNLSPGPGKKIAFVIVAADGLEALKINAQALADRYIALNTSPLPVLEPIFICKGESITLRPSNGNVFRFYNAPPSQTGSILLSTGSTLTINALETNQRIYITCIDEVFESSALEVLISVSSHKASFEMSKTEIDLSFEDELSLSSSSADGTAWEWQINRSGEAPNASIGFINGTYAQSESPQVSFAEVGVYEVKLISQNAANCSDYTSQLLNVVEREIPTSLAPFVGASVKVYPNPIQDKLWIEINHLSEETLSAEITNAQGQSMYQWTWRSQATGPQAAPMPALSTGVYFLKITHPTGQQSLHKLIKQ